ncbi:Gfo/Idh/MocA family oxidoreductase [Thermostilla marina]
MMASLRPASFHGRSFRFSVSRRRFLGNLAFGLAAGVPSVIPGSALGLTQGSAPSERIRVGLIGCGGHGAGWNLSQIFRHGDAQVVAVCDVDKNRLAAAKKKVDDHYRQTLGESAEPCTPYGDFRKLINRKDIDAIVNVTPDHWHVIPAIMAAKCGKDVCCEKPLTLFIDEGKILCRVIRETNRVFQTASENRSIETYIRLISLVRSGVIGKLKHIEVRLPMGNSTARAVGISRGGSPTEPTDPPPELDFDMWLGQAPKMPYIPAYVHYNFRWNLAFSGGVITDWGAHMCDLAQWGHNSEHSGPVEVEGQGDFPPRDAVYNAAPTFRVQYRYADGVTLTVSAGRGDLDPNKSYEIPVVGRTPQPGIRFEGTDGWIESHKWRGSLKASDREMLDVEADPRQLGLYVPGEVVARTDTGKGGEHRNFFDCVKSRKPCYAPAEIGHRTITIPHIGNIAMQLGRKLRWNPETETFVDDDEANRMLSRPQRDPWSIERIDSWIEG